MRPKVFRGKKAPIDGFNCSTTKPESENCISIGCWECIFGRETSEQDYIDYIKYADLTKINSVFGDLPEDIRKALKEAWNGKDGGQSNIQYFDGSSWKNHNPSWWESTTYRLDPSYKPEEKSLIGTEVEVKVNGVTYKARITE